MTSQKITGKNTRYTNCLMVFGCLGCCVNPHGKCSIFAMVLGITAYLFLSVAMWSCVYMRIDGYLNDEYPYILPNSAKMFTSQIGLFNYQEFGEFSSAESDYACVSYSRDQIKNFLDAPFRLARSFAAFANIFIGAGALVVLLTSCAYFDVVLLRKSGWLFIVGSVLEMLTFVVYASDVSSAPYNGSFWWGSGLALAASIVSLIAGLVTMQLPESEHSEAKIGDSLSPVAREQPRAMRPGSETTTETILPDGRRKYTTTKWKKDGKSEVSETIV